MRKRLSAIDRATSHLDSGKRKAFVSDLEAQLQAITGPIAAEDPMQACDLLLRLLELSEGALARCVDSTGALLAIF